MTSIRSGRARRSAGRSPSLHALRLCFASASLRSAAQAHPSINSILSFPAWISLRVGDGMLPETYMGPAVSKDQQETVLEYLKIGQDEGAKVGAGDSRCRQRNTAKAFTSRRRFSLIALSTAA